MRHSQVIFWQNDQPFLVQLYCLGHVAQIQLLVLYYEFILFQFMHAHLVGLILATVSDAEEQVVFVEVAGDLLLEVHRGNICAVLEGKDMGRMPDFLLVDDPVCSKIVKESVAELFIAVIGLQLLEPNQVHLGQMFYLRAVQQSSVLNLTRYEYSGACLNRGDFDDLVYDFAPDDGLEWYEIAVFYGFVCHEVVFAHLKDMSQVEIVPLPVPLRISLVLLIHDGTVLRGNPHLHLSLHDL
jgi:hypothetical protein